MNPVLKIIIIMKRKRGLTNLEITWIQRVASSREIAHEITNLIQIYQSNITKILRKPLDIDHWHPTDISILMHYLMIFGRDVDIKKMCERLLYYGANTNTDVVSPLYLAILLGDVSLVKLFIASGANINQVVDAGEEALPILGNAKLTPLTLAVMNDDPVMVNYLLDRGANASYATLNGNVSQFAWNFATDSVKSKCIRLHPAYNEISESLNIYVNQANTKQTRQKILKTLHTITSILQ